MIEVITGLPGHGKTLYAIERYRKSKRQVYYHGIKDLRLPWIEWDPKRWTELPTGALFVIDEAQFVFPLRGKGEPDKWIADLAVHRHKGIDIVLITQNPMLIDSFVRRLVDHHLHVVRKFGTKFATIHEYTTGVREEVAKSRGDSIKHEWRYPSDVFALYKSAELHTAKARIPMRVFGLVAMVIALPAGAAYWWMQRGTLEPVAPITAAGTGFSPPAAVIGASGPGVDLSSYLAMHRPRIEGLAYTAPVYDKVTEPIEAPFPSACVQSASVCRCYSQQGTRLDVPDGLCAQIVEKGFFVSWRQEKKLEPVGSGVNVAAVPAGQAGPVLIGTGLRAVAPVVEPDVAPAPQRRAISPR
jgi:zona occludens toxin